MVKIIDSNIQSQTVSNYYSMWQMTLIGVILGFIFLCLTVIFGRFTDSTTIPGDIATILVATVGTAIMVRFRMVRPLIITVACTMSLWGLAGWTNGLVWGEVFIWDVILYGLTYTLFSWIARYERISTVLIAIITILVIVRITATL